MAQVLFYEKPGCINNTRQKKILRQAGHTVVAMNLLTENWTEKGSELRAFFADKPVHEWFNRSAPVIKQGIIDPEKVTAEQAISLMQADPLLIRRPLMQSGSQKMAGFNEQEVMRWIGLATVSSASDLENCPKHHLSQCSHG